MSQSFLTCAQCGARNKPKWDFCARCGESLDGVTLAGSLEAEELPVEEDEDPRPGSTLWRDVAVLVLLVSLGGLSLSWARSSPGAEPVGVGFVTIATLPPAPPPAAVESDPAPAQAAFQEGRRRLAGGDAAGAVELLAQAVGDEPDNALFRSVYAQALLATGATDEGLLQYGAAVQLEPSSFAYAAGLARELSRADRPGEAIAAYEAALTLQPSDVAVLREAADLLARGGQPDRAASLLARAAELRPGDLALEQQLGRALEVAGSLDQAAEVYQGILDRMPEAHLTRGLLAEVLFQQGQAEQAIAVFRAGLERDGSAPLLYRGLGSLLERAGRAREAIAAYREYARLTPGAPDASQLQERAALLEKRFAAGG